MRYFLLAYVALLLSVSDALHSKQNKNKYAQNFVVSTTRIYLNNYPKAFNPSIIAVDKGFLLTFRHCLAPHEPWTSYIGLVALDEHLRPISAPQLLRTRHKGAATPSQSEDARIFICDHKVYLIYNDNVEVAPPDNPGAKRDIFLAQLLRKGNHFTLSEPRKLMHTDKAHSMRAQKNWTPFEWNKKLLVIYNTSPHEVLYPDLRTGLSNPICSSSFKNSWHWGEIRGGTPAQMVGGQYLAFFHSSIYKASEASRGVPMHHYYMGAYTFAPNPPFTVTKMSPYPIIGKGFYTRSDSEKKVIFPGGFAHKGKYLYVAYGKDDREIWVAVIDKDKLFASLKPCGN